MERHRREMFVSSVHQRSHRHHSRELIENERIQTIAIMKARVAWIIKQSAV
ncbi:AAEL015306-PA [Aedes aegypti]|uniref:AAEL015306-PA n=1 Tax=Aedes aegypti TaxID=7159 RepID=Q1DH18_AEDAE|nr:AAEL015306-PA [Aedes aegypti]